MTPVALASSLPEHSRQAPLHGPPDPGRHHEQQHQELLLTDIKDLFSCNPPQPALRHSLPAAEPREAETMEFVEVPGGVYAIGADGPGFHFDNEMPRHRVLLPDHRIANRSVLNGEFRAFVEDGGYREPGLWLSDGRAAVHQRGWSRPLYWNEDLTREFTLAGDRAIDPTDRSFFYPYARWQFPGFRLARDGI